MATRTRAAPATRGRGPWGRRILIPLVLAQFLCSYAASSLNVAISAIAGDLGTNVTGVQTADHRLHADHGGADDPREQADRLTGPQALLPHRARRLRRRRADGRCLVKPRPARRSATRCCRGSARPCSFRRSTSSPRSSIPTWRRAPRHSAPSAPVPASERRSGRSSAARSPRRPAGAFRSFCRPSSSWASCSSLEGSRIRGRRTPRPRASMSWAPCSRPPASS